MALALRLRRAIAVTSTPLRPAASSSISRPLSPAPFFPLLPAAAAGFRSTAAAGSEIPTDDETDPPANGVDYKHWYVSMGFSDPKPSREEMLETYLQTIAKVVGSYEEAKRRMYAFSTTTYTGFQARMSQETAEKFYGLPGVSTIWPDGYVFPDKKQYGGDTYGNGVITPFRPYHYWGKSSRPDRNHTFQRNNQDRPSMQGS